MRDRVYIVDINTKMYQIARYKQNDNNVSYNMRIVQDSIDVDLTGYTALAFFSLPSGRITQKNCTIEGSTVYTELSHIELSEEGEVTSEITLYKDDKVVTTFSTIIKVEKSINRNAIEDEPSWDIIKDILNVLSYEEERQENENVRKSNEEIRISSENVRIGNENVRIESENQRKDSEVERCESEEVRKTQELTREANEETRKTSETTREANEEIRKTSEITREANEEIRKANEIVRESSEETRNTNEETREGNETVRKANEELRKTSEETREGNENTRKASEEIRNGSEETRVTNEVARQESETKREESEDFRKTNEETREENEELRKSNENTRKASEEVRKTSEETRNTNEEARKASEEIRKTSEITRNTNEETRKASEITRETNEETRKATEIIRQNSEIKREENEELRESNEETRELNESTRQTSITNMQKKVDDKVVEVDNKIVEVNTAKTDMTTTVSNKITEFENRFEELESLDARGELMQARETIDGTVKDTLKDRLTYDFEKVNEKIAEMTSAATNIAFSKSYVESDWIADGEYFKLTVNHNLVTENIFVAILDESTKKSMTNSYTVVDNNTIDIFNELAIDVKVTVVNGNTNKEVINATINDNITTLDSTYSSVKIDAKIDDSKNNIYLELNKKASKESLDMILQLLENSKKYTVTYNINLPEGYLNENVVLPNPITVLGNIEVKLCSPNITDLIEYRFKGWSLTESGDVIERCIATDDITLYAIWYKCINVTYELNLPNDFQGTPIPDLPADENKYILGDIVTLLQLSNYDENNKEYNYKFCGWSLTESGDVIENATIENEHVQSDGLHLYAVWKKYRYVTYNANFPPEEYPLNRTGEVPVDTNRYVEGDTVTVLKNSENNPLGGEEDKDKFLGWASNIEKAQIPVIKSDVEENIVIGKEDITLYGMWGKYRIAYGSNGKPGSSITGHAPYDPHSYLTGASVIVPSNPGNLDIGSYELLGWSTVKDDESTMLNFGDRIMIDKSNIILQAFWRKL
ncbi:InlB B-repeat-containing protein [Clostridioides sp. ZZV14-6150]|uniref:hypothetical protein n=1 Tax=Clostridioides sp. ZZV14-6150 TaxID=2811493 RepID=UPI001D127EFD|nr:InlB B-repeat-containing protein [Clostridioides sp. ZZV14-6150]